MLLTEAMNSWDVGRGRGGVEAALAAVTARAVVAGVDTDRLYPIAQQQQVAEALGVPLHVIESPYGHDGFLIEVDAVGRCCATCSPDASLHVAPIDRCSDHCAILTGSRRLVVPRVGGGHRPRRVQPAQDGVADLGELVDLLRAEGVDDVVAHGRHVAGRRHAAPRPSPAR